MTRTIAYTLFAAAVLAPLPLSAQSAPAASPTATSAAITSDGTKTVTGCVAAGVDARTFTFTESATTSSAAADRAPAPAASATAIPWTLMAHSDIDLAKYVGKKVELTGSSDMKGGVSADKSSSSAPSANATTGPRFHVKSVKVLGDTCS
jgi:hypothetical protein